MNDPVQEAWERLSAVQRAFTVAQAALVRADPEAFAAYEAARLAQPLAWEEFRDKIAAQQIIDERRRREHERACQQAMLAGAMG